MKDGGCRRRQLRMIENLERYVIFILYSTKYLLSWMFFCFILGKWTDIPEEETDKELEEEEEEAGRGKRRGL